MRYLSSLVNPTLIDISCQGSRLNSKNQVAIVVQVVAILDQLAHDGAIPLVLVDSCTMPLTSATVSKQGTMNCEWVDMRLPPTHIAIGLKSPIRLVKLAARGPWWGKTIT